MGSALRSWREETERAGPTAEAGPAPVEARGVDDILDKADRPGRGTRRRRREKSIVKLPVRLFRIKILFSKGEIYISLENEAQVKSQNRCIVKK